MIYNLVIRSYPRAYLLVVPKGAENLILVLTYEFYGSFDMLREQAGKLALVIETKKKKKKYERRGAG